MNWQYVSHVIVLVLFSVTVHCNYVWQEFQWTHYSIMAYRWQHTLAPAAQHDKLNLLSTMPGWYWDGETSSARHTCQVQYLNQPPRPTQPTTRSKTNEYQPKPGSGRRQFTGANGYWSERSNVVTSGGWSNPASIRVSSLELVSKVRLGLGLGLVVGYSV